MALVTANGLAVIDGTIEMPLEGVWLADLAIDNPAGTGFDPGTRVALVAAGGVELDGTVAPARSGAFLDTTRVRILGGAAGMASPATPRGFVQPGAYGRDVLNQLAKDSGETLADNVSANLTGKNLTAWAIHAGMVSSALRVLLDIAAPTMTWRITSDGKLWIGEETWPDSGTDFELIDDEQASATQLVKCQAPFIYPGQNVPGIGHASKVEHQIMSGEIRTRIWTSIPDDQRSIQWSIRVVAEQTQARFDYYGRYIYKVVGQSVDLTTVDITPVAPNDQRLPGLDRVVVRAGTDVKVQFTQGNTVLLGWDGGDPERPYVEAGLSSETAQRIQLGGNTDAARKGDHLHASAGLASWAGAVELGLSAAGFPIPAVSQFANVLNPTAPGIAGGLGDIYDGSTKVGLG